MKIIGIDTSGAGCSVAVADEVKIRAEIDFDNGKSHSKHILSLIDTALNLACLKITDIDAVSVTKGPGTFTGLRISISCVKGIASAVNIPIVGVSSLEALALQSPLISGYICPMIDARRSDVYTVLYKYEKGNLIKIAQESVIPPEAAVSKINQPCMFTGSGALLYKKVISERIGELAYFAPAENFLIKGATVARMGIERLERFGADDISELAPFYIRESDAEMNFLSDKLKNSFEKNIE